jgi:cytochrome P450
MRVLQEAVLVPKVAPGWLPTPGKLWRQHMRSVVDREVFALIDDPNADPSSLLSELRAAVDDAGSMSKEQLRDEVVTLFLAGHETTALALTWAFYLVALHPEVDRALAAELEGANAARLGADDSERLEQCQRVLKETLRLYPPVYVIPRMVQKPTKLGGYWLAPGAELWLWIYFMQRDPRWFSLPDRFDPSRFAAGGEASRAPKAYAPFGVGTRSCIGRHFAVLEAVLVLASVLRRFRLELVDSRPLRCRPRVTLAPARPVHVRLRAR